MWDLCKITIATEKKETVTQLIGAKIPHSLRPTGIARSRRNAFGNAHAQNIRCGANDLLFNEINNEPHFFPKKPNFSSPSFRFWHIQFSFTISSTPVAQ